jgi:transposase
MSFDIDHHTPSDWKEARRLRAYQLKQNGWRQTDIAEALGVTDGAVSQWMTAARADGPEALLSQKHPGPEPALSPEELKALPGLLARGASHYGFRGDRWTRRRVGTVIAREFGVRYSDVHVGRLLDAIGWSWQKPTGRAAERDEEAIRTWREQRWQALKKSPGGASDAGLRR